MIKITRINDAEITINSDLIEFIEATPDTTITLTTGRKIIAKESIDQIIEKIIDFKSNLQKIK